MIAGQVLADLGADVVAVDGAIRAYDDDAALRRAFLRGKRRLEVAAGARVTALRRLASLADVILESGAPGELAESGLGYDDCCQSNPRLVYVSITPFGQDGPRADVESVDLTVLAASGVLLLTGDADRPPVQLPGEQALLHAGAEAVSAALIALAVRERDGLGQHVDVAAQQVMTLACQGFSLKAAWNDPVTVRRSGGGANVAGHHIRYVYPCLDGHVAITFLFGNVIGPFTRRLFEWMYEEGEIDAATRDKDWVGYFLQLLSGAEPTSELERCTRAIESFTRKRTKAELAQAALDRKLLLVPVNTLGDVLKSPQLAYRAFWRDVGGVRVPGPFARFSAARIGRWEQCAQVAPDTLEKEWTSLGPAPRSNARVSCAPALEGLNVLDLSWVYATPAGVRTLADYGATVIHVESPTRPDTLRSAQPFKDGLPGPERSGQYATIQANKLGFGANLATPEGRALVRRLAVEWADILVESFAPGVLRRLGLAYEALSEENPGLIVMSSSLNGQDGPLADLAGFGTMGAHLAGFGELTGWPDRPPAGPFTAYTDYTAPHFVTTALMAAVAQRRRTGRGQAIDLSQIEVALHYITPQLLQQQAELSPSRAGNARAEMAPHGVYRCRGEERWLAMACRDDEDWRRLCALAGEGWETDPRFVTFRAREQNRHTLDAVIDAWTASQEAGNLEQRLQSIGVPAYLACAAADLAQDPQLVARGHWAIVPHAELGPVTVEGPRSTMSRTPPAMCWAGPMFGEHNALILRDYLGLSEDEMSELAAAGAIG